MTTDNDAPASGLVEALNCLDGHPEYHEQGMGCGLEDRNITDRYEAMRYGWDQAVERVYAEHVIPARDALAALQAPQEAEVSVKALDWRDHRGQTFPDTWTAQTPCGVYEIEERSASDSPAYVATGPLHVFLADKDSLEDAKAAAQADFDKRIRSALSQPVATPAPRPQLGTIPNYPEYDNARIK